MSLTVFCLEYTVLALAFLWFKPQRHPSLGSNWNGSRGHCCQQPITSHHLEATNLHLSRSEIRSSECPLTYLLQNYQGQFQQCLSMALAEKDCTVFNHSSGKTSKALLCVQYCIHACLMHPEKKWLKKVHSPCAHKLDGNKFTCHTTTYLTCFPPHKSI